MKRPPIARTIFRGGKYRSDADVPETIPIVNASGLRRLSSGMYRGVLMIQVRRQRGYQRVYMRGVATIQVDRPECRCGDCGPTVTGMFERQWKPR